MEHVSNQRARRIIIGAASAAFTLVFLLVLAMFSSDDIRSVNAGGEDGIVGGDFTLTSAQGNVSLSDFRSKIVVVYFGFVRCSQVCPKSMKVMQNAFEQLTPSEANQVQVILVSFDGEDTYKELDAYVKEYNQSFIGVTGSFYEIEDVVQEYGAFYTPNDEANNDPSLAYRHTSRYFIVDQEGAVVDSMRHSTTSNELLARLRTLI
jgi:protein SCO1/2